LKFSHFIKNLLNITILPPFEFMEKQTMLLLSFKTNYDAFSFSQSRRLSHYPALKPNNTNRNSKPKLKAKRL